MNGAEVIVAKAIFDHIWGNDDLPADEADCCAPFVLEALQAAGYAVVELPKPLPGRVEGEFPRWDSGGGIVMADTVFNEVLFAGYSTNSSDARALAVSLLSAADAAEASL